MHQNPLQLFVSLLAAREEVIFMIRIIGHQMHEEFHNKIGTLKDIQDEIYKGEVKRELLENQLYQCIHEGFRKIMLPKIIQKYHKITSFYLVKTQIYFPKQGQLLCQELVNQPGIKKSLQQIIHDPLVQILKFINNFQKQRLRQELLQMSNYEQEDRCNRNEKFFSEPLTLGICGLKYLNELHRKFGYSACKRSNRNVYDILNLEDQAKQLYMQGGGFMSLLSSITKLKDKSVDNTQSVYIPIESTQEITTQRQEKLLKELLEQNIHVKKSVNQYVEKFNKFQLKKLIIEVPIHVYSTSNQTNYVMKSHRMFSKKLMNCRPLLSDTGRYSEPIGKNPLLTESLNTNKEQIRSKKSSQIILNGFVSPKQTVKRKHRSLKNCEATLLKPSLPFDFQSKMNNCLKKVNQ